MASAACCAIVRAVASVSSSIGAAGSSERIVSSASSSVAVAIGSSAAVEPLLEERHEQRVGSAEACRGRNVERLWLARARRPWLRPRENRPHGVAQPRFGDVHRLRNELVAALVGNANHGRVDTEHLDDRLRDRLERRLERQALRERARDLVERVHLAGSSGAPTRGRRQRLAELGRLLVQPRVLDRDGELCGERGEQREVALAERPTAG